MKPQRFYGLHMVEGLAEYREPGKTPYRIFVNEATAKKMDPSFEGSPVFVHHVDEVDYQDNKQLKADADGYVVKSFFNKADGRHWVEFMVVSEAGLDAVINKKWKLSNAYVPKSLGAGGVWHGLDYDKEVLEGVYEHLAIVPNPRYAESVILTPEQFKTFNSDKESEITKLMNSKKGAMSMFNFFKREKLENTADLEQTVVTLPKSGKEKTIAQLVNEADESAMSDGQEQMANGDHCVMVGEEKMKVNDLIEKHLAMKAALEPKKEEEKNDDADKSAEEAEKKPDSQLNNLEALKNAEALFQNNMQMSTGIDLPDDQLARGAKRYGR